MLRDELFSKECINKMHFNLCNDSVFPRQTKCSNEDAETVSQEDSTALPTAVSVTEDMATKEFYISVGTEDGCQFDTANDENIHGNMAMSQFNSDTNQMCKNALQVDVCEMNKQVCTSASMNRLERSLMEHFNKTKSCVSIRGCMLACWYRMLVYLVVPDF